MSLSVLDRLAKALRTHPAELVTAYQRARGPSASIAQAKDKLEQAERFLARAREGQERSQTNVIAVGDDLSAFLHMLRSSYFRLQAAVDPGVFTAVKLRWDAALTGQDRKLFRDLLAARDADVHESNALLTVTQIDLPAHRIAARSDRRHAAYQTMMNVPPGVMPPVVTATGVRLTAASLESCKRALSALQNLLDDCTEASTVSASGAHRRALNS